MRLIERLDPPTGTVEVFSEYEMRHANAHDPETLAALDRLVFGYSESELVGFYRLRILPTPNPQGS